MKVVGMNNGNYIRMVLPNNLFHILLERINDYDENIRRGLCDFLRLNDVIPSNDKPFLFEKDLTIKSNSDKVYASIISDIISDIALELRVDSNFYEFTTPCSQQGFYFQKNFNIL